MPSSWPKVGRFLAERTGHDFPVLARHHHSRAIQSVASTLRENLDPTTTGLGLDLKVLSGLIFAELVGDDVLKQDVRALAPKNGVSEERMAAALRFATDASAASLFDDDKTRAVLVVAKAASPSPVEVDADVVATCKEAGLSAADIVELVTWISVLQMLHRLSSFYAVEGAR